MTADACLLPSLSLVEIYSAGKGQCDTAVIHYMASQIGLLMPSKIQQNSLSPYRIFLVSPLKFIPLISWHVFSSSNVPHQTGKSDLFLTSLPKEICEAERDIEKCGYKLEATMGTMLR